MGTRSSAKSYMCYDLRTMMRTLPTKVLEMLLDLSQLDTTVEVTTVAAAYHMASFDYIVLPM